MEFLNAFEAYLQAQARAETTVRGYLADTGYFARWFEQANGSVFIPQRLTPADVLAYRQALLSSGQHKARTVNRRMASLSAFIQWLKETGQISDDFNVLTKSVRREPAIPRWLSKKEQVALREAIQRDLHRDYPKRWIIRQRDASLVLFLLYTGLRLTELLALRLGDLQLSEQAGSVQVRKGKPREVPFSAETYKALQDWLAVRPQRESELLWIAVETETKGLSERAIQQIFRRYAQEAGLETFTPSIARHTCAKNLINSGMELEKAAFLLGHSNPNTLRIYYTLTPLDIEAGTE